MFVLNAILHEIIIQYCCICVTVFLYTIMLKLPIMQCNSDAYAENGDKILEYFHR